METTETEERLPVGARVSVRCGDWRGYEGRVAHSEPNLCFVGVELDGEGRRTVIHRDWLEAIPEDPAPARLPVGTRVVMNYGKHKGRKGVLVAREGGTGPFSEFPLVKLDEVDLPHSCCWDWLDLDPAVAESDLMSRLEEGVEPPADTRGIGPVPSVAETVKGAVDWQQEDPELRRVHVAVHSNVVDVHANLSPFSAARKLRLAVPFCAEAVVCFIEGMMLLPDRGVCITVAGHAEAPR